MPRVPKVKLFQPMLAVTCEDMSKVRLPVYASCKYNGVRCVIRNGESLSRRLKLIPNRFIRAQLAGLPDGLDGELIVGDVLAPDVLNKTTSGVMSEDGEPDFTYNIFDREGAAPYVTRLQTTVHHARQYHSRGVRVVDHRYFTTLDSLVRYEEDMVAAGWEGIMIRDPGGMYKFGRSTLKEGGLLKVKRFHDAECVVTGVVELMHNENELDEDERGYAKRSKAKAGLVPTGTMGTLRCKAWLNVTQTAFNSPDDDSSLTSGYVEFEIGTGFTSLQRVQMFAFPPIGKVVKFKYQMLSPDKKPLALSFQGFRDVEID